MCLLRRMPVRRISSKLDRWFIPNDNTNSKADLRLSARTSSPFQIGASMAHFSEVKTANHLAQRTTSCLAGISLALFSLVSVAIPATADAAPSSNHSANGTSASRRAHSEPPAPFKYCAYSSCVPPRPMFGYGVGDNSRNQTW